MSSSDSGIVGPGTARAINSGRESLGVLFRSAQQRLQHVFIAFVVGLIGGILAMRWYIWPQLREDLLVNAASIIAKTPFDVILMQVKIGLFTGVGLAVPVLLYHARRPLQDREIIPEIHVSRVKIVGVAVFSAGLAAIGIMYAYFLFFPLMFEFLAGNAVASGLAPKYSIVKWTEFILFLTLSFALAAQLPLIVSAFSYSGIVPYETFRDKWRYAVVGIFAFGAMFSPPDPFTQILWATPLILLYGLSLYLAKIVVTMKRGGEYVEIGGVFREKWNRVLGVGVVGFAAGYGFSSQGGVAAVNDAIAAVGSAFSLQTVGEFLGVAPSTGAIVLGAATAVVALLGTLVYYVYVAVERAAQQVKASTLGQPADPENIDLGVLDAAGVRSAPPEAFASMSEDEALAAAQRALGDDDDEKAQAILDRFDEVHAELEEAAVEEDESGGQAAQASNPVQSTAAGMMDAFSEDETTEDDIGGYYHDIRFIFGSLRSRSFRIVGTFMALLVGIFGWLYYGGFGDLRDDFIARIPQDVQPAGDVAWPITQHPVEALVFQVKISTVLAAICTLPMLFYYVWPALSERGFVTGDRRAIGVWGGGLVGALLAGSYLGYSFVAPEVISYLVYDALQADMVISYTVSNFAWTVFLLTGGIGLLADIPVTMVLFHLGGIVSYETMRRRWRVPVISAFAFGGVVTPDSLYTMLLIAFPMVAMYFLGLAILHLVTLGGRLGGSESAAAT